MEIRPVTTADLDSLAEIDATIESTRYMHIDRAGHGVNLRWKIDDRPLRKKLIEPNPFDGDCRFIARQIAAGQDEGITLMIEHDDQPAALLIAQPKPDREIMQLIDLRVDCEHRRQGLATGLIYQVMQLARDAGLRALYAQTRANHYPAAQLMLNTGFELTGLDTHRSSNHDLVKEMVTLFWYATID